MPARKSARPRRRANPQPRLRVRTYRHGLGDCHLLRFTKDDGTPLHMLVDCGIVDIPKASAEQAARMVKVAENISRETQVLDIVVATHQHTDHLSGFRQGAKVFDDQKVKMNRLWFAWTEKKGNLLVKRIKDELERKLSAVRGAASRLAAVGHPAAERIQGTLDFFGPAAAGDRTQAILDDLEKRVPATPDYLTPGDTFLLPGVSGVRVYVLGPPTSLADLKICNPRKTQEEGYEIALAASAEGLAAALADNSDETSASLPFAGHGLTESQAKDDDFFKRHYFTGDSSNASDPAWRKIDTTWLEMAEQLALALNDLTNNTSLVLAFEFIQSGEVLLFPGDAQIGSWLTWKKLKWSVPDKDGVTREITIRDLFARTIFYKASHHASHNGTLSGLNPDHIGLEQMTHPDLICVAPVDIQMSKAKKWIGTLPWEPLLNRLRGKTRGRLILTDAAEALPDPDALTDLSAAERRQFRQRITTGADPINHIGWVDYTLEAH